MVTLRIDNREVEVAQGATVLDAARVLGIDIPTLCHLDGCEANSSCMVCVVRVSGRDGMVPACSFRAEDGLEVECETPAVHEARRTALELLLGDHGGDCLGQCQRACPAGMDIPAMIRQIAGGEMESAIETVKAHIALPAVLGRICPAPCERACRRSDVDGPLSICLLKRFAADVDLARPEPWLPAAAAERAEKVAVVGAGPAGLAAAHYLRRAGIGCTIFDDHPEPGGGLRYGVPEELLPRAVLDAEIALIEKQGTVFRLGCRIGETVLLDGLRETHDAVLLAVGPVDGNAPGWIGRFAGPAGIAIDKATFTTNETGIYAAGDAVRKRQLAVWSVAQGRTAAHALVRSLTGETERLDDTLFSTTYGRLKREELESFPEVDRNAGRVEPADGLERGFTPVEARAESQRCLHCDCRKLSSCALRAQSIAHGASARRFRSKARAFEPPLVHDIPGAGAVIYEPGKCIACGLCIQISARDAGALGLSFHGRGFDVRVRVPFGRPIEEALAGAAEACVAACPPGQKRPPADWLGGVDSHR